MAATHQHIKADGESYVHTHGIGNLGAFTPHHHAADDTFPPGDLPLLDDEGYVIE